MDTAIVAETLAPEAVRAGAFLYRLSLSPHRDRLVLKGGMLLAAYDQRRPTRDVDLLARAITNDANTVAALVRQIATIEVDDGMVYEPDRLTARTIREQDQYAAVRVVVPARVGRAGQPLRVDVNVGDPVIPVRSRYLSPRCWATRSNFSATPSRPCSPRS